LAKILLTGFTLGAGFKGGEVTPFLYWCNIGSVTFCSTPIVYWQEWACGRFLRCYIYTYRLHHYGNGTFWDKVEHIYRNCLCFWLWHQDPVGIYHSQIVKGPNIIYIKIKKGKLDNFKKKRVICQMIFKLYIKNVNSHTMKIQDIQAIHAIGNTKKKLQ
jgi:hypothetical protein